MIEVTSDREIITIELAGSTVFGFMDSRSSVEQRKSLRVARHGGALSWNNDYSKLPAPILIFMWSMRLSI